jgi:hypothetical protein
MDLAQHAAPVAMQIDAVEPNLQVPTAAGA